MKRDKSIEVLNKAVAEEMTALQQYMYFHFHCDDQGYDLLASVFRRIAMQEMLHCERFAERILFLKGEVELKASADVIKEHDVKKMLEITKGLEENAIEIYNQFANDCGNANDAVTKKLFEDIVTEEEDHYDNFDDEIENMNRFGENYLTLQAIERAKNRGANKPAE